MDPSLQGSEWADENRGLLCKIKACFILIALALGMTAAMGLSPEIHIMKDLYWVKYEGKTDYEGVEIYGNIYGLFFTCGGKALETGLCTQLTTNAPLIFDDQSHDWAYVAEHGGAGFNHECKDSATAFTIMVIGLCVVGNFADLLKSQVRADRKKDLYVKCPDVVSVVLKMAGNFGVVLAFPEACGASGNNYVTTVGPGWYCLLFSILIGNLPGWIISIIIPAPDPKEIELKEDYIDL